MLSLNPVGKEETLTFASNRKIANIVLKAVTVALPQSQGRVV